MKRTYREALLLGCIVTAIAAPAGAADRVRPGQWEITATVAGRTINQSTCMSKSDADRLNGDVKSVRGKVEEELAIAGCTVKDIKVNGNQVVVTSACPGGKENVGTTTYHGDSLESVNTNGARSQSKWVGPCK
jgi:hypothetical protein